MGKSQTSAYRTDLAIARSIRQGLSLRFFRNDPTLGSQVVIIMDKIPAISVALI